MKEANEFFNKLSTSTDVAKLGTVIAYKGEVNRISMYDVELADGTILLNVPSGISSLTVNSLVVLVVVDSDIDSVIFNADESNSNRSNNVTDSVIIAQLRD